MTFAPFAASVSFNVSSNIRAAGFVGVEAVCAAPGEGRRPNETGRAVRLDFDDERVGALAVLELDPSANSENPDRHSQAAFFRMYLNDQHTGYILPDIIL